VHFKCGCGEGFGFPKTLFYKEKISIKYNIAVAAWDCGISNISYASS
jgi:hypothetical protein